MTKTDSWTKDAASPDLRNEAGPFDIIGDVHGCASELETLLAKLGYELTYKAGTIASGISVKPPPGRRAVFVGDLVDRGPRAPDTLRIVMAMVEQGVGFCVPGNHDTKFLRWLDGHNVQLTHGLDRTTTQFEQEDAALTAAVRSFLRTLPTYAWLDGGALVVAHAGIQEHMIGNISGKIRSFCLYGDTANERDPHGLPVRYHWAAEYSGDAAVIYGHTPVPDAEWVNNTLCIDTGCCFGGKLSALRWPERHVISVPAEAEYAITRRPFGHPPVRPRPQMEAAQPSSV